MSVTALPLLLTTALFIGDPRRDPSAWIPRLGAVRYVDRQEAAAMLRELGAAALPALQEAKATSDDPEIRYRAAQLAEVIESQVRTGPLRIRLDFSEQPLGAVLREIGRRAEVDLLADDLMSARLLSRTVTLEAAEPVGFWTAIDRLAEVSG